MNRNVTLLILLLLVGCISITINSCKKEEPFDDPADDYSITVFTNQTGDPNADALQAQIVNSEAHFQINMYGQYIDDNTPGPCTTVTYQRDGNDTTVIFIMDPVSLRLRTAYLEVNGTKQPWVIKHSYIPGNDSAVTISIYDYDWSTNVGTLEFESTFETQNGVHTESPIYGNFKTNDLFDIGAVGVGLIIAEAAFYGTGVGFLGTAAGIALVGAVGTIVTIGGTVAIVVGAVAYIISGNANAASLEPGTDPYPGNAPVNNPATGTNDPTPNLPVTLCSGITIDFSAGMNEQGGITIFGVSGGTPPYSYSDQFPLSFQSSSYFGGNHSAGTYSLTVKDANGCIEAKSFNLQYVPLEIGLLHQGGIIFYFLTNGDPGYDPNLQHGLLASPIGSYYGATWGCVGTALLGADGTLVGAGYENTLDIVNGCPPEPNATAARYCYESTTYGYTGWYLPSKEELAILYSERDHLTYSVVDGWTSSEISDSLVWAMDHVGQLVSKRKDFSANSYAIRSF